MKTFLMALSMVFVLASCAHKDHSHSHHHASHGEIDHSKTFETTPELSVRMEKLAVLEKEIATSLKGNQKANLKPYSGKIMDVVNDIFKTCELPEEADNHLHHILEVVIDSTHDLDKGKNSDGIGKLSKAISHYNKAFYKK